MVSRSDQLAQSHHAAATSSHQAVITTVFDQLPTSADNVTLPAFGRHTNCYRPQAAGRAAIDRYLLPAWQQTHLSGVRRPGVKRRTDGEADIRTDSVNNMGIRLTPTPRTCLCSSTSLKYQCVTRCLLQDDWARAGSDVSPTTAHQHHHDNHHQGNHHHHHHHHQQQQGAPHSPDDDACTSLPTTHKYPWMSIIGESAE